MIYERVEFARGHLDPGSKGSGRSHTGVAQTGVAELGNKDVSAPKAFKACVKRSGMDGAGAEELCDGKGAKMRIARRWNNHPELGGNPQKAVYYIYYNTKDITNTTTNATNATNTTSQHYKCYQHYQSYKYY